MTRPPHPTTHPARPTAPTRPTRHRRGTVVVAIVVALVTLQLTVAAVAISGARDQDLIARRLDSTRAFYAAEAGINLAAREIIQSADHDADGSIGSVSNNNTPADDPELAGARVVVDSTPDGAATVLTARARCRESRRTLAIRVE